MKKKNKYGERALTVAIYKSAAYYFESAEEAAKAFNLEIEHHIYARISHPNAKTLSEVLAVMENGEAALVTNSGMSAIQLTIFHVAAGKEFLTSNRLYGGTYDLFKDLPSWNMKAVFVKEPNNIAEWERKISKKTAALFIETPSNPDICVIDIKPLADLAHHYKIPLIVDNTVATPYLQKPLNLGANIVIHSVSKALAGHGQLIGGAIIGSKIFIRSLFERRFITFGVIMSPPVADLATQGIESLAVRMNALCKNATLLAIYLKEHPLVKKVNYPALANNPYHELMHKQMGGKGGPLLSFEIKGGRKNVFKFLNSLKFCTIAANIGDVRTLVMHPATTTHHQLTKKEQKESHIPDGLIRVSLGLENFEDIVKDFEKAFLKLQTPPT